MKCLEIFDHLKDAERYVRIFLNYEGADPEIVDCTERDPETGFPIPCIAVYYNPRRAEA